MKKYTSITSLLVVFVALAPGDRQEIPSPEIFPVETTRAIEVPLHLYKTTDRIILDKKNLDCLAKNIYYESGIESLAGKIAVAQVTFNRVESKRWGKTVCEVVYAKAQFSWTLDKKKIKEQPQGKLWDSSVAAAKQYLEGTRVTNLLSSTHYHTDWIDTPKWAQSKKPVQQIGSHVFYAEMR